MLTAREETELLALLELESPPSFREFLTSADYCGLEPSPMVAAIVDASEGVRPTTIDDAASVLYFGCALAALPDRPRRTVAVQAGGRGGKTSRLLAPKALHAAWTVPLPTLAPGEHALALIVSSELAFALQAFAFCKGYVEASPVLSAALVGEPTRDCLTLRRPDGHKVDVRVRAAGARGKGGRAFTLVAALLDEVCFFFDESGVVNDKEIFRAVSPRVVPGGQVWMVSTPWAAGVGLLEEKLAEDWGAHEGTLCARGIGTRALNPGWDPTGEIEAEARKDPDNAAREIDAQPLAAGSLHFFSHEAIEAAMRGDRPRDEPAVDGAPYGAAADAGFVRNSSALALVRLVPSVRPTRDGEPTDARFVLARLEERRPAPGLPLKPEAVSAEFAGIALQYGAKDIAVDTHERERVAAALLETGCAAVTAPEKNRAFVFFRNALHEGRAELPHDARLRQQLRDVMVKPLPGGGSQIYSPKRRDGSHGDLVSAVVNAVWRAAHDAGLLPHRGRAVAVTAKPPDVWGGGASAATEAPIEAPRPEPRPGDRPRPRGVPPKPRGPW